MDEQAIRDIVRQAVARHMGPSAPAPAAGAPAVNVQPPRPAAQDPSHFLYDGLVNVTDACVIEPATTCDHCGYCKSHGH